MSGNETISEYEKICFSKPWSRQDIDGVLNGDGCVCVCDMGTGYAFGRTLYEDAELFRIAVLPEKRRTGAGSRILAEFIDKCAELGAEKVFLEVNANNAPAVGLYEKAGFSRISLRKNYYDDGDALIMQYTLRNA